MQEGSLPKIKEFNVRAVRVPMTEPHKTASGVNGTGSSQGFDSIQARIKPNTLCPSLQKSAKLTGRYRRQTSTISSREQMIVWFLSGLIDPLF